MTVLNRMDTLADDMIAGITDSPTGYTGVEGDAHWAAEIRRLADLRNATVLAHNLPYPRNSTIASVSAAVDNDCRAAGAIRLAANAFEQFRPRGPGKLRRRKRNWRV